MACLKDMKFYEAFKPFDMVMVTDIETIRKNWTDYGTVFTTRKEAEEALTKTDSKGGE